MCVCDFLLVGKRDILFAKRHIRTVLLFVLLMPVFIFSHLAFLLCLLWKSYTEQIYICNHWFCAHDSRSIQISVLLKSICAGVFCSPCAHILLLYMRCWTVFLACIAYMFEFAVGMLVCL